MKYYVYIHYRLDTNEPFYIGKGCGYRYTSTKSRSKWWNSIKNKYGFRAEIYSYYASEVAALSAEICLIQEYKSKFLLCNLSNGGDGAGNGNQNLLGHKHSEETKKKIGKAAKGRKQTDRQKQITAQKNMERVWSEASRAKARLSALNRKKKNEQTKSCL